jgi:membrane protein DedA with SNARE-associated domain
MTAFLVSFYVLICLGYVLGFLNDNDDIPNAVKVLMTIFSSIVAPVLFGAGMAMIILAKVKKETNRE